MLGQFKSPLPATLGAALLIAFGPVPLVTDAAHAGGKSRSETRVLSSDAAGGDVAARSTSRRAARADAAETEEFVQTRSKRSRRNPGETESVVAEAKAIDSLDDLIALAERDQPALDKHISDANFEGITGALALYQLTGKAAADTDLTADETTALAALTEGTGLPVVIEDAEARLIELTAGFDAGGDDTLNVIAAALGFDRTQMQQTASAGIDTSS